MDRWSKKKKKTQAARRLHGQKLTFVGHVDEKCLLQLLALLAHELHKSETEETPPVLLRVEGLEQATGKSLEGDAEHK